MEENLYEKIKKEIREEFNAMVKTKFKDFQKLIDEQQECIAFCSDFGNNRLKLYIVNGDKIYIINIGEVSHMEIYDKNKVEEIDLSIRSEHYYLSFKINNTPYEMSTAEMNSWYQLRDLREWLFKFIEALK